jgi:hypothetical protein
MIWIKRRSEGFAVSSIAALEYDNAILAYLSVNYPRHLSLVLRQRDQSNCLEFAHLQYRSSLFDEGRDVIFRKDS